MPHLGLPLQLSWVPSVWLTTGSGAQILEESGGHLSPFRGLIFIDPPPLGGWGDLTPPWSVFCIASDLLKAPVSERNPSAPWTHIQNHPQSLSEVNESLQGSPILNLTPACALGLPSNYECVGSMDG